MNKEIFMTLAVATVVICAATLSSCVTQQAPIYKTPDNLAKHEIKGSQPTPLPVAASQSQAAAPSIVAQVAQRQEAQPQPPPTPPAGKAATTPEKTNPQVSPVPIRPERRLSPPPSAPASSGGMISLNFTRADLVEIIHIIAQHLHLTYTIDPEVKGTVTINSAEPLKSEDLLPIFHQLLRMNGAVAVRSGNLYRIVPIKDGKSIARPAGQSREDSFALQIVPVRYFAVAEMKRLLTPFLMPGGEIIENPRGNFLIIVDLPSNIQRLMEIAEMIDVQVFAGTRMEIYQPKVASAEELAQEMTKIMQSFASSVPQAENFNAEFIALPRINQLLVISHSEAAWTYAKRWIDRIDVVTEGPGRRIFIYQVENGKATELADVLGQALGQPVSTARSSAPSLQSLHRTTAGAPSGMSSGGQTTSPLGGAGTSGTTYSPGGTGSAFATVPAPSQPGIPVPAAPSPAPAPGQVRPGTPTTPSPRPEEKLRIVADPGTNSLIIYGSAQEFQNIKNILKELDAIPRQVLLDVLIAEIQLNNDQNFGIDYEILQGNVTFLGQTFASRGALLTGILSRLGQPVNGITPFPGGVSGVVGDNTVKALINALQADSRFKVLSSPTVLATDNRPARIQVGSEEPIPTGSVSTPITTGTGGVVSSTTSAFATSTTVQYRNTGRIVTIIPQVNSQGLVNLQILAEVSQRGANVLVGSESFPSFDIRQAETTAVVQNGDTLVIGGIIADNRSRERSGIPYLMDVPVFGRFFGSTLDTTRRTELIMLITPHVIRNREESQAVTDDFKNRVLNLRIELERERRDHERELERLKKLGVIEPKDSTPSPGTATPEPQLPAQPSVPPPPPPAPAPATGALRAPPPVKSSDAAQMIQPARRRDAVKIKPQKTPVTPPVLSAPSAPTPDVEESPQAELANDENTKIVSVPYQASVNLARAAPDEAAKRTIVAPEIVWAVQVASYARDADARALATKLKDKGYNVNIVAAAIAGQSRYRVEVGPLSNRSAAQAIQTELATIHQFDQALILSRSKSQSAGAQPY
jgi:general secretion pathway protein D